MYQSWLWRFTGTSPFHIVLYYCFWIQDEKPTLERPVEIQRRYSLIPPGLPGISIIPDNSGPEERPRRPSTQSLGPLVVPVSLFGNRSCDGDRPRRPSTHSVGILPISMFGEIGERPRRPSTHSLGVFPLNFFSEDRDGSDRGARRPSTHSLGPLVIPVSRCIQRRLHLYHYKWHTPQPSKPNYIPSCPFQLPYVIWFIAKLHCILRIFNFENFPIVCPVSSRPCVLLCKPTVQCLVC